MSNLLSDIAAELQCYTSDNSLGGWITELNASNKRKDKEAVLKKALAATLIGSKSAQCFLYCCYLAYNPFLTFNIRQVPDGVSSTDYTNPWGQFFQFLSKSSYRSLSGNAQRAELAKLSTQFDQQTWDLVCKGVILKDLRCGISEKTLNTVLKRSAFEIPVFGCQLAQDSNDHLKKLTGQKRLEVKLDGIRALVTVTNGKTAVFSRTGKQLYNFTAVQEAIENNQALIDMLSISLGPSFVLDGEIVSDSFQQLMKQAHRKTDVDTSAAVYYIFDAISMDDFARGNDNRQQYKRLHVLNSIASYPTDSAVKIMQGITVNLDTAEGHDIMRRYAEDAVAAGYEGIMIKDLGAPYECRRNSFWLKWKPFIEVSLTVMALEEGTGRNAGRLGALVCEGIDDGKVIRSNVSGFTDRQREEFWANPSAVLGSVAEVRADVITQNQDGTYSLRFPRFQRFRGFEPGEKL